MPRKRSVNERRCRGRSTNENASSGIKARAAYLTETIDNLLTELGPEDDDDRRIFELLGGRVIKTGNRPTIAYLNDDEERAARRLFVKLLRGDQSLSREIRNLLAALFDPDPQRSWVERQLVFRLCRGRKREFHRDLIINLLMHMQVGAGIAVKTASDKVARALGMTSDAVRKVWQHQRIE
jgi:hypothetical protein